MAALGVSLIEQPFPRANWNDARILKRLSPIPVIADESITSPTDLDSCTEAFHGINVKPMKAGGITPSLALLRAARDARHDHDAGLHARVRSGHLRAPLTSALSLTIWTSTPSTFWRWTPGMG